MIFDPDAGQQALAFAKDFDYIRETGTTAERKAADRIRAHLESLGLTVETEAFPMTRSLVHEISFEITKPFRKAYPVAGIRNSASANVTAGFAYIEDADEVSLRRAKGNIVLYLHKPTKKEYDLISAAGALGIVAITGSPTDVGESRVPQSGKIANMSSPAIPVVLLHYCDAMEIIDNGACEAHLKLTLGERQALSQNVITRIPGTQSPETVIALTAHYDSVPEGRGAYDNLSGCAIIYSLCRYFAAHPPKCTMEFIFFGAEEIGIRGSRNYLKLRKSDLARYALDLNVDLAGQAVGGTVIGVTADDRLDSLIGELILSGEVGAKHRASVWSGDANAFAYFGIPALTLDRDGFGMHTRHDTLRLISAWALQRDITLYTQLAAVLDDRIAAGERFTVPEDMLRELKAEYKDF